MARLPTIEEFVKETAEKVLDDYEYEGKTIREWVQMILNSDAVPVVRCKDCKWRQQDDINRNFCGLGDFYCGETDYCSRGEKMDGDVNG